MKQKYTIAKDKNTGALTIQEHAELSKDLFSLICEETYDAETIKTAIDQNKRVLIDSLRTPNLYPISKYIDKIADTVISFYDKSSAQPEEAGPVELVFDDVELFKKEVFEKAPGEESVEIEDLLEDDTDENVISDSETKASNAPLDVPIDTSDDASHESPDDTDKL